MRYSIREIRKRFKEALDKVDKGESVEFTRKGVVYTITKESVYTALKDDVLCTQSPAIEQERKGEIIKTSADVKKVLSSRVVSAYGCGCEKESGKILCQKHSRY
jgi:hypothetical protein